MLPAQSRAPTGCASALGAAGTHAPSSSGVAAWFPTRRGACAPTASLSIQQRDGSVPALRGGLFQPLLAANVATLCGRKRLLIHRPCRFCAGMHTTQLLCRPGWLPHPDRERFRREAVYKHGVCVSVTHAWRKTLALTEPLCACARRSRAGARCDGVYRCAFGCIVSCPCGARCCLRLRFLQVRAPTGACVCPSVASAALKTAAFPASARASSLVQPTRSWACSTWAAACR